MKTSRILIAAGGMLAVAALALAQRPGADRSAADDTVARMMAFDKNQDGKLTKEELDDDRLHRLFDRADADKDGTVTKEELTALVAREDTPTTRRGPGGPGGPPMMGMPRPGEILPAMARRRLEITPEQATKLDALQKEVDARLAEILDDEQEKTLKEMANRPPGGGPGPGGGPPRRGGPPARKNP